MSKLKWLSITMFFYFPITFAITYFWSTETGHVYPFFPYISDTGTYAPEHCFFGQMLNLGAFLIMVIIYLVFKVNEGALEKEEIRGVRGKNRFALILGVIATLALTVVANFQEMVLLPVHIAAAFITFGCYTIYTLIVTLASRKVKHITGVRGWMIATRFTLSAICITAFVLTFGFAVVAALMFEGNDPTKWRPKDGGYGFHVASTVFEWVCGLTLTIFLGTTYMEFGRMTYYPVSIDFSSGSYPQTNTVSATSTVDAGAVASIKVESAAKQRR